MNSLGFSQRENIVPAAGQPIGTRFKSKLLTGKRNKYVDLLISIPVTLAGAGTTIKNRGSALALCPTAGILEGGVPKYEADSRLVGILTEARVGSARTVKRLTSTAAGDYVLEEMVRLYFENPFSLKPSETRYLDRPSENSTFEAFVTFDKTGSQLVTLGAGATITVGVPTIEVLQEFDVDATSELPVYTPGLQVLSFPINNVMKGQGFTVSLDGKSIRSLTILQDSDVGEVADMIDQLQLSGTRRNYIGEDGPVNYKGLCLRQELEQSGNMYAGPGGAYLHINCQNQGKLSDILQAGIDGGLQLKLWGKPSAVAGASNPKVLVLVETLEPSGFAAAA